MIKVEHLSKEYLIRHNSAAKYSSLRDELMVKVRGVFRKDESKTMERFMALNDVSFEVNQGDRVGIIGRNGAGKSTLLKVLSRIVTPTSGKITIEGRVASLLEVGTGFNPELTGRENIFLNGSILGMSREEIRSKFDEIVAFSEVEKFLDTPVKRYSSGMYVRLAFSVAAHLEPEILIVDEVLAVGDAAFQKKCLGKMKDVSGQGRTVLFVSHNMAAVQNLCDKAIFLKGGQIIEQGAASAVLQTYLKSSSSNFDLDLFSRTDRQGTGVVRFTSFVMLNDKEETVSNAQSGEYIILRFGFESSGESEIRKLHFAIGIDDDFGVRIAHLSNDVTNEIFDRVLSNNRYVDVHIPRLPLRGGTYNYTLFSSVNGEISDYLQNAGSLIVESGDFYKTGKLPPEGQGNFFIEHHFNLS